MIMKRLLLLLAITLCWCANDAFGQTRKEKHEETDGYVWYEIKRGEYPNIQYGVEDNNGKTIVPIGSYDIRYQGYGDIKHFLLSAKNADGDLESITKEGNT